MDEFKLLANLFCFFSPHLTTYLYYLYYLCTY
jgi:hypothetical protein